ncbi:DUF222 domain-containing protein [uncultured Amnibacterium sp.]|uniref:HNH endonuclease signature motif containing protein n=1 Tax=uncultured Amnibacterium sp. TaxID=1631851 RepID=UPI0035C98169
MQERPGADDSSDDGSGDSASALPDFASLDAREALFTSALEQADRVVNTAEAMRLQVMLAGFDAMLIEEQAETGRALRPDDAAVRAFCLHQANVLRVSRQTVERRIDDGRTAREKLPTTWAVFLEGLASEEAVRAAARQTIGLKAGALTEFDAKAADLVQTVKAAVVEKRLGLLRDRLDPNGAIERHERAATRRWVSARLDSDGMAVLEVHSTAIDIAAMYDGIRQAAIDLHGRDGEHRTLGQLMADVATDVVLHGLAVPAAEMDDPAYPMERIGSLRAPHRKAVQATVLVVVPADTATGARNAPAELAGMGAIDAETARQVIGHTKTWTRVAVDPIDDSILGIDSHDRYIPAGLKKLLHLRTPSCVGDDCGLPAHRADIDHITRVEHDGRTRHDNLQVLCRKSHQMKDEGYFDVQTLPDGTIHWHDKWGGNRITRPALTVRTPSPVELFDDPPFSRERRQAVG